MEDGRSKGGRVRAEKLSPEQRKEIAAKAATARWRGTATPIKATHAGLLHLAGIELECANLPDGRRVVSERGMMKALGRGYSGYYSERDNAAPEGAAVQPRFLAPKVLKPYISKALEALQPIAYIHPKTGAVAKGVDALAIPAVCEVWIKAEMAGVLSEKQTETARKAQALYDSLAKVAIAALVDEATGAQFDRARDALSVLLEQYVTEELAQWAKTFEDGFYKEIFRLRGWDVSDFKKRPGVVGKWTRNIVYERLAPGLLQRLQEIVPRDPRGRLIFKLHQGLTRDRGYIALKEHLASVTTIMKLAEDEDCNWFMRKLDKIHPRYEPQLMMPFMKNEADSTEA
jgi:hypothetical protein